MPECGICGENEEKLFKCKMCDTMFCEYCGVVEDWICFSCMVEIEYENENYARMQYHN